MRTSADRLVLSTGAADTACARMADCTERLARDGLLEVNALLAPAALFASSDFIFHGPGASKTNQVGGGKGGANGGRERESDQEGRFNRRTGRSGCSRDLDPEPAI